MHGQVHALHLHGTGTPLGDPIEMGAAAAVLLALTKSVHTSLDNRRDRDRLLALVAHKSAAGHAEAAAGLLGLTCATLALESATLPPILHLRSGCTAHISCNDFGSSICGVLDCYGLLADHAHQALTVSHVVVPKFVVGCGLFDNSLHNVHWRKRQSFETVMGKALHLFILGALARSSTKDLHELIVALSVEGGQHGCHLHSGSAEQSNC
jgi:hypothetical protein